MREALKLACVIALLAALPATAVVWLDDRPDEVAWAVRFLAPAISTAALVVFLKIHFRRDEAPDFLRDSGNYFTSGGLGFIPVFGVEGRRLLVRVWFQNQYERSCTAKVAFRPARGFFMGRGPLEPFLLEFDCKEGGFGYAEQVVPVPRELFGKRLTLELGASVRFPDGRGRQLRFHTGMTSRYNHKFGNSFGTTLGVLGLLGGMLVTSKPATVVVDCPVELDDPGEGKPPTLVEHRWRLGDAPSLRSDIEEFSPAIGGTSP